MEITLHLLLLGVLFSFAFAKAPERRAPGERVSPIVQQRERARLRVELCKKKKCYRGEVCQLKEDDTAECVCLNDCTAEQDVRYHVCSTKNVTFHSECLLDRQHCLCKHKMEECQDPRANKIQLDYFGQCRELTECPEEEFQEFPHRMKEWLFIVMKQLASRDELGDYITLLEQAQTNSNHTEAVLWKFCDLDASPQDRRVSRRELQYIVQSLKAWEHCLVPFLAVCDRDNDRKITLKEWGTCLGVEPEKIEDKCVDIRNRAKRH